MFEDEDVILPEDFEESLPELEEESIEETTEDVEQVEDTTPTEPTEPIQETPQTLKLKYNKEEREIPIEEAVLLAQKGMNLEKAVERAKQEARDTYIAEQGYEWNGKPITTEAEYKQALQEKEWMEKYQSQDLPDDVVQELIESRRDREERRREKEERAKEERKNAEFQDFFQYFKQANGRDFDTNNDQIPTEVWEAQANGVPLRFAYMEHQNKQLANQIKVLKQNQENSKRAPVGSVATHGSTEVASEDDFLSGFNSI